MMPPIKNFDPYTASRPLQSPGSLRNLARRIKTRALRAVGHAGRFLSAAGKVLVVAALFWPLWLAIDCAILASACDDDHSARVTMPQRDATTHASDADGEGQ